MAKSKNIKLEIEPKKKGICFVIMPFRGYFDSYYENIYYPAIKDAELEPVRADNLFRSSAIIKDIWDFTKKAVIVLADLTTKNPNVFYELGLAHAIQKPAVLVSQTVEDIPFDLRHLRYIEYDVNVHNWGDILKNKITEAIKETLEKPKEAVLSYFLDVKEVERKEVTETDKELMEMKQDIEYLKKEIKPRYIHETNQVVMGEIHRSSRPQVYDQFSDRPNVLPRVDTSAITMESQWNKIQRLKREIEDRSSELKNLLEIEKVREEEKSK